MLKPEFVLRSQHLVNNLMECKLDQFHPVNYYHLKDPISGHLNYYEISGILGPDFSLIVWGVWGVRTPRLLLRFKFLQKYRDRFLSVSNHERVSQEFVEWITARPNWRWILAVNKVSLHLNNTK
ncbi:hypothetical protein A4S05_27850 [Nostoc sp. KVJ20]|nr:hypothetical protein A4S05_27850 [Nostoc sp. KVJ20]